MSSTFTALKLITSLSGPEKRHFRLFAGKQNGEKDYMSLFELMEQHPTAEIESINKVYLAAHPGSSLDSASRYLVKLITDALIQLKIEKDTQFNLLQNLMRVKVLQERSLTEEAFHELRKIRKKAQDTQNHFITYITYRYQLNHLSEVNFPEMTDDDLIEMQMKTKGSLRTVQQIEGHYALYELLKYRLDREGGVASDEDRKKLNDLLLSEMSLVTGKVKNSFESRKLHLLFQSFFFTHTGDHKSALKTFNELNRHFELHAHLQQNPPIDYFSSLDGILDSLRSTGDYELMPFYIAKIGNIDISTCPDHFRFLLQRTIVIYTLATLLKDQHYDEAIEMVKALDQNLLKAYHLIHVEKRLELYLYCSLAYFGKKEYKKALKFINEITVENSKYAVLPAYKVLRLLQIIIHYELKNISFLSYEIRSYKRFFQQRVKTLKTEKLIFKTIQMDPDHNTPVKNRSLMPKIEEYCKGIHADKYEKILLKYVDLTGWAQSKFK